MTRGQRSWLRSILAWRPSGVKFSSQAEDTLMQGVGQRLDRNLTKIGKEAYKELLSLANKAGIPSDALPYVLWVLDSNAGLPHLPQKEGKALQMAMDVMRRTGWLPHYSSAFTVVDNLQIDQAIDKLSRNLGTWSLRSMYPEILKAYQDALKSQVKAVPKATQGRVAPQDAFNFLRLSFRQVVTIDSSMFRDGELLRRVVRLLPL